MHWLKKTLVILCVGWFMTLIKHFYILPTFNNEDHDITGFEFRIRF